MANEVTVTGSLNVYKSSIMSSALGRSFSGLQATMTGNLISYGTISVGTSAEAIPLGEVTQPGWSFFKNADSTNRINLRNGASGADVVELLAGEVAMFRWYRSATPYAISITAACVLEFLIISL